MKPNLRGSGIHIVYGKSQMTKILGILTWNILSVTGKQTRQVAVEALKTTAIGAAREIAKKKKVELYIHGRDGKIKSRDSYGKESKKKDKR